MGSNPIQDTSISINKNMHPFENFAYAKLNIEFDSKLFAEEYDKYILPSSMDIAPGFNPWYNTRELNRRWGMVDPDLYNQCDIQHQIGTTGEYRIESRGIPQWKMNQLLNLRLVDSDSDYAKKHAYWGCSFMRNHHLDRLWVLKSEFKHLKIVEFILKKLPFSRIVGIHCVSLEPGSFASIHRDVRYNPGFGPPFDQNIGPQNGVFKHGHVLINLNISDGGVPLWWSLDGKDHEKVLTANDQVYLTSDYFLHGVPVCSSRRRQIRITGVPTAQLASLIDHSSKIELPADYEYDTEQTWYPG